MTKQQAKEMLPIIKAFIEGKTIQVKNRHDGSWNDNHDLVFGGTPDQYRIKPERRLIPFSFEDSKDILGKTLFKDGSCAAIITYVSPQGVYMGPVWYTFENLLGFKFEDGSVCGKYVD